MLLAILDWKRWSDFLCIYSFFIARSQRSKIQRNNRVMCLMHVYYYACASEWRFCWKFVITVRNITIFRWTFSHYVKLPMGLIKTVLLAPRVWLRLLIRSDIRSQRAYLLKVWSCYGLTRAHFSVSRRLDYDALEDWSCAQTFRTPLKCLKDYNNDVYFIAS